MITLFVCIYVQQCSVTSVLCMWVYMWTKKQAVWGLTTRKSFASVIYTARSSSLTAKKGVYYARWFVLGKKFGTILWDRRRILENCITVSHALSTCNAALQMQNANIPQQTTAVQTYNIATDTVCTDSAWAHRVCVLWNSGYDLSFII